VLLSPAAPLESGSTTLTSLIESGNGGIGEVFAGSLEGVSVSAVFVELVFFEVSGVGVGEGELTGHWA